MHDLLERLEALADEGTPRGAADVLRGARETIFEAQTWGPLSSRERRRSRLLVTAFAVVLVVVLAVSAVLISRGSDPLPRRRVDVITTPPAPGDLPRPVRHVDGRARAGVPLFLVPDQLPAGLRLLRVTGGNQPGREESRAATPGVERFQQWTKFDASGTRPVETFSLQWGLGVSQDFDPTPVTVRGVHGSYWGRVHTLSWDEPPGRPVVVSGDALSLEDLLAIADGLDARPDGGFDMSRAPDGYVEVAEGPGTASEGTNLRNVIYWDGAGRGFDVRVVDGTQAPPGASLSPFFGDRLVEVRGHHAVVGPRLASAGLVSDQQTAFLQSANQFVQWLEPGNVRVTVSGVGLSEDEVLAVAEGLRAVDAEQWEQLLVQAPGRSGAAPSGSTETPPTFTGEQAQIADAYRDVDRRAHGRRSRFGCRERRQPARHHRRPRFVIRQQCRRLLGPGRRREARRPRPCARDLLDPGRRITVTREPAGLGGARRRPVARQPRDLLRDRRDRTDQVPGAMSGNAACSRYSAPSRRVRLS